jgi:hypothetical protein
MNMGILSETSTGAAGKIANKRALVFGGIRGNDLGIFSGHYKTP